MSRQVRRGTARAVVLTLLMPVPLVFAAPARATHEPVGTAVVLAGGGDGDGAAATGARVRQVRALAYHPDGDLLLVESATLRRVDAATGLVSTVYVDAAPDPGLADVAVGADGATYVVDDHRVRAVGAGEPTTVGGLPVSLSARQVAVGPDGDVFVAGWFWDGVAETGGVFRVTDDGVVRVLGGSTGSTADGVAARDVAVEVLRDVEVTAGGDLLFVDGQSRLRRVPGGVPDGVVETLATGGVDLGDVAVAPDGTLYLTDDQDPVRRLVVGSPPTVVDTGGVRCDGPVAVSPAGVPAVACAAPHFVAAAPGDGSLTTLAGGVRAADGTAGAEVWFDSLVGVAADRAGGAYVLADGALRTLDAAGVLGTAVAGLADATALTTAPDGTAYVATGPTVRRVDDGAAVPYAGAEGGVPPADGVPAASVAFGVIRSLAAADDGTLWVGVEADCALWRVDAGGVVRAVPLPPCAATPEAPVVTLAPDGSPVVVRDLWLYLPDDTDTLRRTERWGHEVAVTADGVARGLLVARRPDGAVIEQGYDLPAGVAFCCARGLAADGATLLGAARDHVLRLTPVADRVVPPTPTGLVLTPGPGTLTATWDPVAGTDAHWEAAILPGTVAPRHGEGTAVGVDQSNGGPLVFRRAGEADPPGLRAGEPYTVSLWAVGPGGRHVAATATAAPTADTTAPGGVAELRVTYDAGTAEARWTHLPEADHWRLHARLVEGTEPPASPAAGLAPATAWTHGARWPVGTAETTYAVAVWVEDLAGNLSAPTTATLVVDRTPPATPTGLAVATVGDTLVVTWDPPAADAAALRLDLGAHGGADLAGDATRFETAGVAWGETYAVALTAIDAAGNTSAPATTTFVPRRAATLSLAVAATTVTYGGATTLRGRLADTRTGAAVTGRPVQLWARRYGASAFSYVATRATDADGRVAFGVRPAARTTYRLVHVAGGAVAGTASVQRTVLVRAKVAAALSSTSIAAGRTAYLTGRVGPKHVGVPVSLQRYVPGVGWRGVSVARTASDGTVRFALRPPAGRYAYRLYFGGDADHLAGVSPTLTLRVT